ncbi:DUF1349 domain-containing protein [Puniceicoccaceae bacterium K14]|nr:DUF1349 domain-containing protein [Puniceicoccaceae bacterium K14]
MEKEPIFTKKAIRGVRAKWGAVESRILAWPTILKRNVRFLSRSVFSMAFIITLASTSWGAEFELAWSDNSNNESGFVIERSTDGENYVELAEVDANVTAYTDETITGSNSYWYRVYAYNSIGRSDYTNIVMAEAPLPAPDIAIVSNFDEDGYGLNETISLSVSFTGDISELASVEFYVDGSLVEEVIEEPWSAEVSFSSDGEKIIFVKAINSNGETSVSEDVVVRVNEIISDVSGLELQSSNVGAVGSEGSLAVDDGTITVVAGGADIWGTSDSFKFLWTQVSGDFEIYTEVQSLVETNNYAKAGIMVRSDLAVDATNVYAYIRPAGTSVHFGERSETGGETGTASRYGVSFPIKLKIKRIGNDFTASYSLDGEEWIDYAQDNEFDPEEDVYVGLATTAHNLESATTAVYSGLSIDSPNQAPTIADIEDISILNTESIDPISLDIQDEDTLLSELVVSVSSSNEDLVVGSSIVVEESGDNRSLLITPEVGAIGVTQIIVSIYDGINLVEESFNLTITDSEHPVISFIPDTSVTQGNLASLVYFQVSDLDTETEDLIITFSSNNESLVAADDITLSGTGSVKSITIDYDNSLSGIVEISVHVSDGLHSVEEKFELNVNANSSPTISEIEDVDSIVGREIDSLEFSIEDLETPLGALIVTGISSNQLLLSDNDIEFSGDQGTRTLVLNPVSSVDGTTTITVLVSDGFNTTSETFELTIVDDESPVLSTIDDLNLFEGIEIGSVEFSILDIDTSVNDLSVTVSSSNPEIVSEGSMQIIGDGSIRQLDFDELPGAIGATTIIVSLSDGNSYVTESFEITIQSNEAPEISDIEEIVILGGEDVPVTTFSVDDEDTSLSEIEISVSTNNEDLIPADGLALVGSNGVYSLGIIPASDVFGIAEITIRASDGLNGSSTSFTLTINDNSNPTLSEFSDVSILAIEAPTLVEFKVSDAETALSDLILSISSSNPDLILAEDVSISGDGVDRSLLITPLEDSYGVTEITVHLSDGVYSVSKTFEYEVIEDEVPYISDFEDVFIEDNLILSGEEYIEIPFNINDLEMPVEGLVAMAVSTNQNVLNNENIDIEGVGESRILRLLPTVDYFGESTVSVIVSDGVSTSTSSFQFKVAKNGAPTMTNFDDLYLIGGEVVDSISFSISDDISPASELLVSAISSNANVISQEGISISGDGSSRTLSLTPKENVSGESIISVSVSDGGSTQTKVFKLTVIESGAPLVSENSHVAVYEGFDVNPVTFDISDDDVAVEDLSVTIRSSNIDLIAVGGILVTGELGRKTVEFTPNEGVVGISEISILVSDGVKENVSTFLFSVIENEAPEIQDIEDQFVVLNGSIGPIELIIEDREVSSGELEISVETGDVAILAESGIHMETVDGIVHLYLTPEQDAYGEVEIEVSASDGKSLSKKKFSLMVERDVFILEEPLDVSVLRLGSVELSVVAFGENLSYQWYKGLSSDESSPVSGATDSYIVIDSVVEDSSYWVKVWSGSNVLETDAAYSDEALITIRENLAPTISGIEDQVTSEDSEILSIEFSIDDSDNYVSELIVLISSDNSNLLPEGSVEIVGEDIDRTINLHPVSGEFGKARIQLTISDGQKSASSSFDVIVEQNLSIIDQPENIRIQRLDNAYLSVVASGEGLAYQWYEGVSGDESSLIEEGGSATLTLNSVEDESSYWVKIWSESNVVNTDPIYTEEAYVTFEHNISPTISEIDDQVSAQGIDVGPLSFSIGDVDNYLSELTVTVLSDNESLFPESAIEISREGNEIELTLSPDQNGYGTGIVQLVVSDGTNSSTSSFEIVVEKSTVLVEQPESVVVKRLDGAVLSVLAEGNGLAFQWFEGSSSDESNPLSGEESPVLTINPVLDTSSYWVKVWSESNVASTEAVHSAAAVVGLEANVAPTVSDIEDLLTGQGVEIDPLSFVIADVDNYFSELTITVSSDNQSLFPDGMIELSGTGNEREIMLSPVVGESGSARVQVIVNDGQKSTSTAFGVLVEQSTSIVEQPSNVVVSRLSSTELSVTAQGDGLAYQWYEGSRLDESNPVEGAESRTLVIGTVLEASNYWVKVWSSTNSVSTEVVSSEAVNVTLEENVAPTISDINDQTIAENSIAGPIGFTINDTDNFVTELIVSISSNNATLLPEGSMSLSGSGNDRTFSLSPAAEQSGTANVQITVSDGDKSSSTVFSLIVEEDIEIGFQSVDIEFTGKGEGVLSVEASGENLTYQWYEGAKGDVSSPVDGATSSTLDLSNITKSGEYWVRVISNGLTVAVDEVDSDTITVTYNPYPYYYFGEFAGEHTGGFALVEYLDNTADFLGAIDGFGSVAFETIAIDENGAFGFSVDGVGEFVGVISDGGVTISLNDFSSTADAKQDLADEEPSEFKGKYSANMVNSADGEIIVIAGPSGKAFVHTEQDGESAGGEVEIDENGQIQSDLENDISVELEITDSAMVRGGASFAGVSFDVIGEIEDDELGSVAGKLANTSMRAEAGEGASTMIAGFVISGEGTKQILIRGVGPALVDQGVTGEISNPVLYLYKFNGSKGFSLSGNNDDWGSAENSDEIKRASEFAGAFDLPTDGRDAALKLDLPAGVYSAHLGGGTGTALIEIYDLDGFDERPEDDTTLVNISMRGEIGSDGDVVIAGFVVTGEVPKQYLTRSVGEELEAYSVDGTLRDPQIHLYKMDSEMGPTLVANNDDWTENSEAVSDASSKVGAFDLDSESKSSALVLWLEPGVYTAVASSADLTNGVALVEVYEVPND